jgi:hypothetical protein
MAQAAKSGHKKIVNRLFTILALSLLPLPADAAAVEMVANARLLAPTASITAIAPVALKARRFTGPGLAFQGAPGQVIGYSAGGVSGVIALGSDGAGRFVLPASLPADVEITLHYD